MDKRFTIFNMDGTLVDSMGYWARLSREYLEGRGVHEGLEPGASKRVQAMPRSTPT